MAKAVWSALAPVDTSRNKEDSLFVSYETSWSGDEMVFPERGRNPRLPGYGGAEAQ